MFYCAPVSRFTCDDAIQKLSVLIVITKQSLFHTVGKRQAIHYLFYRLVQQHVYKGKYTGKEVKPDMAKVWFYYLVSRFFGITFGIKLMEKGEGKAQINYREIAESIPEAVAIADLEVLTEIYRTVIQRLLSA